MSAEMLGVVAGVGGTIVAAVTSLVISRIGQRSAKEQLELADVHVGHGGRAMDPPEIDAKLRNRGGQPTIVKRMTLEVIWSARFQVLDVLLPYSDTSGPAMLSPSATYEVTLPAPRTGEIPPIEKYISHEIGPLQSDRFKVILHAETSPSQGRPSEHPGETFVYLLRLTLTRDGGDKHISSKPVAAACPGNAVHVPDIGQLAQQVHSFHSACDAVRDAVDKELMERGRAVPDWSAAPVRRENLPSNLAALDRYRVNEYFWDPQSAVAEYLEAAEQICSHIVAEIGGIPRGIFRDGLDGLVEQAQATLRELPELTEALCRPEVRRW
jgi:hypothetical protein